MSINRIPPGLVALIQSVLVTWLPSCVARTDDLQEIHLVLERELMEQQTDGLFGADRSC